MFRFTIRELLAITLIVALGTAVWTERRAYLAVNLQIESIKDHDDKLQFLIGREGYQISNGLHGTELIRLPIEQPAITAKQNASVDSASVGDEVAKVKRVIGAANPLQMKGASSALQLKEAYDALFKSLSNDRLEELKNHASDSIALQAAWEQVDRTLPQGSERQIRPDSRRLAQFIGFLQGRARLTIPLWFSQAVLDSRAYRRGGIYAGGINIVVDPANPIPGLAPPVAASLEETGGQLVLHVGELAAPLPADFDGAVKRVSSDKFSALITPAYCYIAVHGGAGYPYKLACVNRSSPQMSWVADVWGCNTIFVSSGLFFHWVQVTAQDNRIIVFGVATPGFYVEAFRAEDGSNLFRVSSNY